MTTIEELRLVLVPVFEAMLHEDERSSLRLHFVRPQSGRTVLL
ncbi:hypothetical protein [Rathayibacter sp. AY1C5]|nr:hypothetical protein [Rathayibacter sp. AY1C5]